VSSTRPPRAARALAKRQEERTPADGLSIEGVFYPIGMHSVGLPDWQAFAVDNSTYFPPTPLRESPNIIAGLQRIAPVIAIRGNVDTGRWAEYYPETQMITLGGRCIYVLHDIKALRLEPASSGVDVILCGHPHRPRIEIIRGVRVEGSECAVGASVYVQSERVGSRNQIQCKGYLAGQQGRNGYYRDTAMTDLPNARSQAHLVSTACSRKESRSTRRMTVRPPMRTRRNSLALSSLQIVARETLR
jgi:hypothetical protein